MKEPEVNSTRRGVEFEPLRRRMVEQQLAARGIHDPRVIEAMLGVPREEFVPPHLRGAAYEDCALPIAHGQTISQPYTVAYMCEAAQLRGEEKVLEIGTGSGYGAAVLSRLCRHVVTVERVSELAASAADVLARLEYCNIDVRLANGTLGAAADAPFDAIIVTAGADKLPPAYFDQIAEGGRIVIPIGDVRHSQTMFRFTRRGDRLEKQNLGQFMFVPLVGKGGWRDVADDA
jgi:protein-L-isoaspartate(D-aspartate) O-methyltransferase